MLNEAVELVCNFQRKANQPYATTPTELTKERVDIRSKWLAEEIEEFKNSKDIVGQADAIIDLLYYTLGIFVEMGIRPDSIFEIVHKGNMEKLVNIRFDSDGKVIKPENWKHPSEEIELAIASACQPRNEHS
jgi:predicted HAD superfamily Cof-like phosphohydrolase